MVVCVQYRSLYVVDVAVALLDQIALLRLVTTVSEKVFFSRSFHLRYCKIFRAQLPPPFPTPPLVSRRKGGGRSDGHKGLRVVVNRI